MRISRTFILILLVARPAFSHPGIGIVRDSKGAIFYTDLKHVWKLTPNGAKSIAVHNVHTHELWIDADDNLYGEHLWYEGDATGKWGHRIWRLTPEGTLSDIIPARRGFRENYGDFFFVRDRNGAMYWADRGDTTAIKKRFPDGTTVVVVRLKFQDVRWMTVTPEGTIYLVDLYDLVRVTTDGSVKILAKNIADWKWTRLLGPDRHAIMGLWTDAQENVYAAVLSGNVVKKISPAGAVSVFYRSPSPWSPTGGLVAPNGEVWILEYAGNNVRVRRLSATSIP